ncbi:MAG: hypothetical protein DRQ40_05060 [Gammaproteobacteria bacterium]|nr:MAG: hypothetical protein DRQ40_05060 [Gammaproteobacteria bacterium]
MNYEIFLPFPPTVNHYYVKSRRGIYISKKGRQFREKVADSINEQLPGVVIGDDDRLKVSVTLHPMDKRKRDVDNYNKALLDAITHAGLWGDDSQVDQLFNYRGEIVKGGMCVVKIEPAEEIKSKFG